MERSRMRRTAYFGAFDYPRTNAATHFAFALISSLTRNGFEVQMVGRNTEIGSDEKTGVAPPVGCSFSWVDQARGHRLTSFWRTWSKYRRTLNSQRELACVIAYNMPSPLLLLLLIKCGRRGIPLIGHCTEWYDGNVARDGLALATARRVDTAIRMHHLHPRLQGLILTSHYLKKFYPETPSIVIPTLSQTVSPSQPPVARRPITQIVYAGSPFPSGSRGLPAEALKDRLDLSIRLVHEVIQRGIDVRFDVYGLTMEEYISALPHEADVVRLSLSWLTFHGHQPASVVTSRVAAADYTLLVREPSRQNLAGFPGKVAESIIAGTPVIVTGVGDLPRYIKEGKTGSILPRTWSAQVDSLVRLASLSESERHRAKQICLANDDFRPESWDRILNDFMTQICSTPGRGNDTEQSGGEETWNQ